MIKYTFTLRNDNYNKHINTTNTLHSFLFIIFWWEVLGFALLSNFQLYNRVIFKYSHHPVH